MESIFAEDAVKNEGDWLEGMQIDHAESYGQTRG